MNKSNPVFILLAALLSLAVLNPAQAAEIPGVTKAPAQTFVDYWNAGSKRAGSNETIFTEGFLQRRGPDDLARIMTMVYDDNGDIAIHSIIAQNDTSVRFVASSQKGKWLEVSLTLAPDQKIDGFGVGLTGPPPKDDDKNLTAEQVAAKTEQYLNELAAKGEFSGSIILAKDGKPLFAKAYGAADKASGRPNTLDTPINLGSMNKMFTGLAITQLVAQGKLAYTDTVGKYLPDYPNETVRNEVTMHQLLTHTSGLGSYWNDAYFNNKDKLASLAEFAATFSGDPLLFAPGTGNEYSNAGPVVLGLILEAITGQDYYAYVREHIYQPAGMGHSDHYDKFENLSGKATGYFVPGQWSEDPEAEPDPSQSGELISNFDDLGRMGSAAGGGYASANDLLKFAVALYDGRLIDEKHREIMTTFKKPMGGGGGYAYLFGDHRTNGKRHIGHNGGAPGINAEFSHFPDAGYTVIVLANLDGAASPVADQIRQWIGFSQ